MEEEERPRKLPKLDNGETSEDLGPAMTGAVIDTKETGDDSKPESSSSPANDGNTSGAPSGPSATNDDQEAEGEAVPKISKKQLKKRRRQEQWEAAKEYRRVKRKEKSAEKRQRLRAEREEAKQQGTVDEWHKARKAARSKAQGSTLLPVTFVIDCGFDDLMVEKERISLASQITRSYSDNSKAPFRGHLVVSSFDKLLKERFETVLAKTHEHWKGVRFMQEDFIHAAEMAKGWMNGSREGQMVGMFADKPDAKPEDGETIYLSSESPNTLTELKPYSTYIIGGLVDKNRYKGICYKRALDRGVKTAKLPIGDYIQMDSRRVLTTNHVMEIMLRWLELGDWGKAFMKVLPQRKGVSLKEQEEEQQEGQDNQEEQEEREEPEKPDEPEEQEDQQEEVVEETCG